MKVLTKEEEAAHYNATVKGGLIGGIGGLALGTLGVAAASRRFGLIRHLTLPMKAFLVTSSATFAAVVHADNYSQRFQLEHRPGEQYAEEYRRRQRAQQDQQEAGKSSLDRAMDWGKKNRYSIVGGSWVASMATALGIVSRSPWLTTAQKLVQARVYAQGLTVAVLIATAAFEIGDRNKGEGRWETVKVLDPEDPQHKRLIEKRIHHERYAGEDQWRDMVEAEERKLKEEHEEAPSHEHPQHKTKPKHKEHAEHKDKK